MTHWIPLAILFPNTLPPNSHGQMWSPDNIHSRNLRVQEYLLSLGAIRLTCITSHHWNCLILAFPCRSPWPPTSSLKPCVLGPSCLAPHPSPFLCALIQAKISVYFPCAEKYRFLFVFLSAIVPWVFHIFIFLGIDRVIWKEIIHSLFCSQFWVLKIIFPPVHLF